MILVPAAIVTIIVVVVFVVIGVFQKGDDNKFSTGSVIVSGIHFLALFAVALSILQLYFVGIEKWIPDLLTDDSWRMSQNADLARYAIATLVVAAPLYLVFLWKGAQAAVSKVSWIKKFMSTTVLFVAVSVAIGSVVAFVYNFLSGELGLRMFAEIVALLVVSGGVVAYYQLYIRDKTKHIVRSTKIFAVIVALVALDSMAVGFMVTGGPAGARAERFDDRRLSDLSGMQWQIQNHLQEKGAMPAALLDLHDAMNGYALPTDPKTKAPYEYRMVSTKTEVLPTGEKNTVGVFELCATFESERNEEDGSKGYDTPILKNQLAIDSFMPNYYNGDTSPHWNHGVGRHCFERTANVNVRNSNIPYNLPPVPEQVY